LGCVASILIRDHPEISVAERVERVRVSIRLRPQMNRQSAELETAFRNRCVISHDISAWGISAPSAGHCRGVSSNCESWATGPLLSTRRSQFAGAVDPDGDLPAAGFQIVLLHDTAAGGSARARAPPRSTPQAWRIRFHSFFDLQAVMKRLVAQSNDIPKPFGWTADSDKIIERPDD